MEGPVRILFASSEVTPFASRSPMSDVIRKVPEYLHEYGGFESRIMMPRYGTISERRNRLHEVIRLSGSKILLGEDEDILKVKVASIPGIRLQVYFMDSLKYFKRKGIYEDRDGTLFPDNLVRAVLFARSVLTTATNLGWSPDVVHAHGWIACLLPVLLRSEYAESPLFGNSRVFYSSDGFTLDESFSAEQAASFGLPNDPRFIGKPLSEVGPAFSDVLVSGPDESTGQEGSDEQNASDQSDQPTESRRDSIQLAGSVEEVTNLAAGLYGRFADATVEA
ncbi:MAG: glycogen/starch synthase [Rhodothermia bacterium]